MKPKKYSTLSCGMVVFAILALSVPSATGAETVATAVYSKISNSYKRERNKDGKLKPEYYALSNGGRIYGTTSDHTVDRVTYPQVAEIATRLLAEQNYRYAQTKEQAKLLLVLQWGSTLAPNGAHKDANVNSVQEAMRALPGAQANLHEALLTSSADPAMTPGKAAAEVKTTTEGFGPSITSPGYKNEHAVVAAAVGSIESQMLRTMLDNRVRDELNHRNAQVLGYADDLAGASDIRRWAGGGDRYNDLITDVEESRYFIVVSAYDFQELLKTQKQKLLWQTRVSVRSPGNSFDGTYLAMLKTAAPYFGQNSGKLLRHEESKGTVELGDLKFLGEVKEKARSETTELGKKP